MQMQMQVMINDDNDNDDDNDKRINDHGAIERDFTHPITSKHGPMIHKVTGNSSVGICF